MPKSPKSSARNCSSVAETMDDKKMRALDAEANYFAMCLLMPRELLIEHFQELCPDGLDFENDERLARLAKRFGVSEQLLLRRLHQLGLI